MAVYKNTIKKLERCTFINLHLFLLHLHVPLSLSPFSCASTQPFLLFFSSFTFYISLPSCYCFFPSCFSLETIQLILVFSWFLALYLSSLSPFLSVFRLSLTLSYPVTYPFLLYFLNSSYFFSFPFSFQSNSPLSCLLLIFSFYFSFFFPFLSILLLYPLHTL